MALSRFITAAVFPALLILACAFLAIHPITDPDFWYHAAFGREYLRGGHIPRADIFSYTANGHPWVSSGWLSSTALEVLYRAAGPTGPILLVFAAIATATLLTYFVANRRYHSPASITVILLIGLLAAYPRLNPRPDVLSLLFIVPLVLFLTRMETLHSSRAARWLWLLPPYIALWANLHALFFLGLALIVLFGAWQFVLWRRSGDRVHLQAAAPCALSLFTWLLNPYGWRVLQFVYDNASLPNIGKRVFELKPLLVFEHAMAGVPVHILLGAALLLGGTVFLVWRDRKAIPPWRIAAIAMLCGLALYQRRQLGLAAIALPALLLPNLSHLETVLRRRVWSAVTPALTVAIVIVAMRFVGLLEISRGLPRTGIDTKWFPTGAAAFLRENPAPPHLFHDLYTGGYLLHELGPEQKVFIDGRLEIYKDGPWQDYFAPTEGRMSSDQLFAKYGVHTALLDIRGAANNRGHLANQLTRKGWLPVYFDDEYCALVDQASSTKVYIDSHAFRIANPLDWSVASSTPDTTALLAEAKRALRLAPTSAAANTAMALSQYRSGNKAEGDHYLRAAQAIDPTIQLARQ